uniref:TBC1 domain family member 9 (Trinotate prediction) n=1 Tax=Myxobolus squamalis TaxID=59785 RepID=A0A6B2G072_MYXSQ
MREKVVLNNKMDISNEENSKKSLSSDSLFENIEEINLCKLVVSSRKEYKKINNHLIKEFRARMQHTAILKVEARNFNSIIRVINRKFGLKENHIKYLFDRFKDCHYKTIFWGDQEISSLLNKMSWKTAIDRFLVDNFNFRIVFNEIFTFGVNQIKFSDLCFNLLSRRDRNEGLVDFSQFISLFVIVKSADFRIKLLLLYQMAFHNVSTTKSTSDTGSINDTDKTINLSMPRIKFYI